MKFLADMGISPKLVARLNAEGHDAVHLVERGWERFTDAQIVDRAALEGRVILTVDLDFGALLAPSRRRWPSVIIFRLTHQSVDAVHGHLMQCIGVSAQDIEAGAIISVREGLIRTRRLPGPT